MPRLMHRRWPSSPALLTVLAVCLPALGCRDEQAGPHPKSHSATSSPSAQGPAAAAGRILPGVPRNLSYRSGATLGQGAIEYLGSIVVPPSAKPGQVVTLAHYFRALREPPQGFGFFVHVVDEGSGQMVGNLDHEIGGGQLPLGQWPVGKVIEDRHTFTMPEGVTGGLKLLLGFWEGSSRLPVDQPELQDGQNRLLGPILRPEGAAPALPEYRVTKTATPPKIDGDTGDAVWQNAASVSLVRSFDGGPVKFKTTARLLYDDRNLYIAFDCEDPDVWGTMMTRDEALYTQEVVEVFLDANGDQRTYNELEVSPNNTVFDASFAAYRSDLEVAKRWDAQMTTAVKVRGTLNNPTDRDEGWSVEMAIPISRLAEVPHVPPQPQDRWRFNLYRLEHPHRTEEEGQAFSPLFKGDFHNLARFGWLVFQ